jgi:molybdopterin-containing oxidoreductase family iron-sulfur binding subunit
MMGAGAVAGNSLLQSCAEEHTMPDDKMKVLTTDGKVIEIDKSLVKKVKGIPLATTKESIEGMPNRKFVMVIDLAKCKNARKCVKACQEGHDLASDQEWMRIYLLEDNPQTAPYWFPRPCFHCDNPLCVSVCPVGATYKRSDGIVLVDSDRCIGCKFCMTGCPYSARIFNWHEPSKQRLGEKDYSPELNIPEKKGTVSKCTFCADKLRNNELPRCLEACPMGVIYFGNILDDTVTNGDETVRFSELMEQRSGYRYLETLGTLPSVFYLPPNHRMYPVEQGFDNLDEQQKARYKSVEFLKNEQHANK